MEHKDQRTNQGGTAEVVPYVVDLNDNDVLLGRGQPILNYSGNVRFRKLIQERKEEYTSTGKHAVKDQIAREVLNSIEARGGRFVRKVDESEREQLNVPEQVLHAWRIVDEATRLSKVKQALREQVGKSQDNPHMGAGTLTSNQPPPPPPPQQQLQQPSHPNSNKPSKEKHHQQHHQQQPRKRSSSDDSLPFIAEATRRQQQFLGQHVGPPHLQRLAPLHSKRSRSMDELPLPPPLQPTTLLSSHSAFLDPRLSLVAPTSTRMHSSSAFTSIPFGGGGGTTTPTNHSGFGIPGGNPATTSSSSSSSYFPAMRMENPLNHVSSCTNAVVGGSSTGFPSGLGFSDSDLQRRLLLQQHQQVLDLQRRQALENVHQSILPPWSLENAVQQYLLTQQRIQQDHHHLLLQQQQQHHYQQHQQRQQEEAAAAATAVASTAMLSSEEKSNLDSTSSDHSSSCKAPYIAPQPPKKHET